ncbi:MAG: zincin-like metallopeptidase domain-containing protein [Desulfuromonadaceae bacterium]|nr:zincin-like metallopeptidase domain-containing protein [Desulfuromonadaceae bacterium]MDD5104797.1 zincin-like metallopeptidase domain-containing protein [Desulfuromonadaceae bacterium]
MDIYQQVTDRIIGLIESGTVPWRKCWSAGNGMPRNMISKKEYRGINVFILASSSYSSPYWLTYRQATELGGFVRKGEKSTPVIFWKMLDKHDQDDDTKASGRVPLLRQYHLFSVEQCDGIPIPPDPEETVNPFSPIEKCEQIIAGYKNRPDIHYGGAKAFYRVSEDRVQMPHEHTFTTSEAFYQVLLHELSHSTGHKSRLARKEVMERNEFGSEDYSSEEICTELSASMLCAVAGISNQTIEMSASYINGWLSVLRSDKKAIVVAAARAQAAADHILGKTFTEEEPV